MEKIKANRFQPYERPLDCDELVTFVLRALSDQLRKLVESQRKRPAPLSIFERDSYVRNDVNPLNKYSKSLLRRNLLLSSGLAFLIIRL